MTELTTLSRLSSVVEGEASMWSSTGVSVWYGGEASTTCKLTCSIVLVAIVVIAGPVLILVFLVIVIAVVLAIIVVVG